MVTAPIDGNVSSGSLPLCKRCFTRHVGQCTIKCHKYGKVGHKISGNGYSQKDKNKAKTGQNRARDWKEREKPKPKAYAS
ncbi:hypothetical protein Tco_0208798, partial [Tanacetum coccineum]